MILIKKFNIHEQESIDPSDPTIKGLQQLFNS